MVTFIKVLKMTIYIGSGVLGVFGAVVCILGIVMAVGSTDYNESPTTRTAIGITTIVVGIIILTAVFLGCFGTKKESLVMLVLFAGCLSTLITIHLLEVMFLGISLALDKTNLMNKMLDEYNTNDNAKNTLDDIQAQNECCGIEGASDWTAKNLTVPDSCCSKDAGEKGRLEDPMCGEGDKTYLHNEGCKKPLLSSLNNLIIAVLGICVFGIVVMAIEITAGILLIFKIRKQAE